MTRSTNEVIAIASRFYDPSSSAHFAQLDNYPKVEFMCWALEKAYRADLIYLEELIEAGKAIHKATDPYNAVMSKLINDMGIFPDDEACYQFWIDHFAVDPRMYNGTEGPYHANSKTSHSNRCAVLRSNRR